ncbi:MAG: response regulator [Aggregatilineales bacterium]
MTEQPVPSPLNVLAIIGDHEWDTTRRQLTAYFNSTPEIVFHGFHESGLAGIEQAQTLQPNVLLVDINPTDTDFIAITKTFRRAAPNVKIVLMRSGDNATITLKANRAGVAAFLQKPVEIDALATLMQTLRDAK